MNRLADLVAAAVHHPTCAFGKACDKTATALEEAAELLRLLAILTRVCP